MIYFLNNRILIVYNKLILYNLVMKYLSGILLLKLIPLFAVASRIENPLASYGVKFDGPFCFTCDPTDPSKYLTCSSPNFKIAPTGSVVNCFQRLSVSHAIPP